MNLLNRYGRTGVSLYTQLARLLRAQIVAGEWKYGALLPPIPVLCEIYGVGTVTVRQALKLLADEGLVTIERGRGTTVKSSRLPASEDDSLRRTISDPLALGSAQTIDVLSREHVTTLPPSLVTSQKSFKHYVRILKTQSHHGLIFSLNEIYVDKGTFGRFPPGADTQKKIARLVYEYGNKRLASLRQQITIVSPDQASAGLMKLGMADYALTGTLVRTLKWWTDEKQRIVLAGVHLYRSDMFVLDTMQDFSSSSSALSASLVPEAAVPEPH